MGSSVGPTRKKSARLTKPIRSQQTLKINILIQIICIVIAYTVLFTKDDTIKTIYKGWDTVKTFYKGWDDKDDLQAIYTVKTIYTKDETVKTIYKGWDSKDDLQRMRR